MFEKVLKIDTIIVRWMEQRQAFSEMGMGLTHLMNLVMDFGFPNIRILIKLNINHNSDPIMQINLSD